MREAVIFMIKHTRPGDFYALEVEMTKFECASVRPATTQHPLVSRDARNAGRSSSHAESSGEENLPKRMHPWRFQAPTLSKRWKQQPQQHQPKMTISLEEKHDCCRAPKGRWENSYRPMGNLSRMRRWLTFLNLWKAWPTETLEDRRPIIVPGRTDYINPDLQIAQAAMQPPCITTTEKGDDALIPARMRLLTWRISICRTICKTWPTTTSWMSMP